MASCNSLIFLLKKRASETPTLRQNAAHALATAAPHRQWKHGVLQPIAEHTLYVDAESDAASSVTTDDESLPADALALALLSTASSRLGANR